MTLAVRFNPLSLFVASVYFLMSTTALPLGKGYAHVRMGGGGGGGEQSVLAIAAAAAAAAVAAKEPTCEELKEMWRFSKRQSRAAEITNELPTYRDPLMSNVWDAYARTRSAGPGMGTRGRSRRPMVFGRIVLDARLPPNSYDSILASPDRERALEELASIYNEKTYGSRSPPSSPSSSRKTSFRLGGGALSPPPPPPQKTPVTSGQFQHLKELIRSERARELLEQRMKEEAVARAEALKDIVNQVHFGRIVQNQKSQLEQAVPEKAGRLSYAGPGPQLYKRALLDYYDDEDDDVDSYGVTWAW